jgi:hypothetical protein
MVSGGARPPLLTSGAPEGSRDPALSVGDQVAAVVDSEDDAAVAVGIRADPGEPPEISKALQPGGLVAVVLGRGTGWRW